MDVTSEKQVLGEEVARKVAKLGQSGLKIVRSEAREFGEEVTQKISVTLGLSVVLTMTLACLTASAIFGAISFGIEAWLACAMGAGVYLILFAYFLVLLRRPMAHTIRHIQGKENFEENFVEVKEALKEELDEMKHRAMQKISPRNIVKDNAGKAVAGSFAAGIALAALTLKNQKKRS